MRAVLRMVAVGLAPLLLAAADAAWWRDARVASGRGSLEGPEAAVREYLASAAALYDTGGDPRAAERIPAAPELVAEMIADIAFAQHRLEARERRQLVRTELTRSAWLPGGGAEVRTREFWVFRTGPLFGEGAERTAASAVSNVRYELAQEAGRWRVVHYRLEASPPAGSGGRR